MVTIKKTLSGHEKQLKVSRSAFKNFYQNAGWQLSEENVTKIGKANSNDEAEGTEDGWDEVLEEEAVTKPISEMTREELLAKAESLGIETTNASTKQLRAMIKAAM